MGIVKVMDSESKLFEVVLALHSSCCLSGGLYSRKQQGDEHPDNGDDYQEFDKSECTILTASG
ncbi:hypothetical protein FACS1894189_0240 [Planctomycetales bacterium]|nr:hypothetical protein FACS1894189_0240 [Planctomycetales bacterium]